MAASLAHAQVIAGGSGGIAGDGQSASFNAPAALRGGSNCDPGDDQTITIFYSIQDSANTATASGTATVTVPGRPAVGGGACQRPTPTTLNLKTLTLSGERV